jgi:hypothetical protein
MTDKPDNKIDAARPVLMAAAEQLEAQGFTLAEISDAMMIIGGDIVLNLQGERAAARVLYLTAMNLARQAVQRDGCANE